MYIYIEYMLESNACEKNYFWKNYMYVLLYVVWRFVLYYGDLILIIARGFSKSLYDNCVIMCIYITLNILLH